MAARARHPETAIDGAQGQRSGSRILQVDRLLQSGDRDLRQMARRPPTDAVALTRSFDVQTNRTATPSSAIPDGFAVQVSPGATGIAFANVPVLMISPAASGGLT